MTSSTWHSRFASAVRWTQPYSPRRSTTWWPATRRCARISLNTKVFRINSCTRHCEVELAVAEIAADQVDETVAELRRHVFTLESEPLIRPTLLALGSDSHVLLLLVHHIVTDHASLGIIFEDLIIAYRARLDGNGAAVGHTAASVRGLRSCGNEIHSMPRRMGTGRAGVLA